MRRLKLLLMAFALFGGVSLGWAQTDVTATYLTNADFETDEALTGTYLYGYGKDGTPYGFQNVTGWTSVVTSGDNSNSSYPNSGMAGGVFGYGSSTQLKGNAKAAPATNPNGEATGKCFGFFGVWGCGGYYYQTVTLAPGAYTITVPMYNQSGTQANTTYTGFFPTSGTNRTVAVNPTVGSWQNQTVSFTLDAETEGQIRIGYQSSGGNSGANPHIFIDCVKITWTDPDLAAAQTKLSGYIKKATALNSVLSEATLGTAITTAEGILSTATTSSACNDASDDLGSAITTALSGLTPVALTNANFDTDVNIAADGSTDVSFIEPATKDKPYIYPVSGWTPNFTFSKTASQGTTAAYGATITGDKGNNGTNPPTTDMFGNTEGGALHLSSGWGDQARYKQVIENLSSGRYLFYYEANNQNSGATTINSNYFGVSGEAGDFYGTTNSFSYSDNKSFAFNEWTASAFKFDVAKTTNITFHVGVVGTTGGSASGAKLWIDNVLVYRIADVMVTDEDANKIIEDAEALNDVAYNATQKSDLASKLSAFKSNKSLDNYSVLNVSLGNAKASADHYQNDLKPIIDGLKGYATADLSAMDNDYNNGVYTNETDKAALIEQYQSIEIPALKDANATNYTSAIINPDFELDGKKVQNPTGWSHTNHGSDDGTRDGSVENMTGWYYNAYQSWWDSNVNIKQTITNLPNGQYTISATLAGWSGCTVNLTANDKWTYINGAGDGTGVDASVTCNVTDGQLDIMVNWGVRDGDNKGTFFKCDNFTLTYNGVKPMLAEAITEANAIYNNGANVGAGVFQIPAAAGTAFSNSISTAQGVYDNSGATASEVLTACDNLEDAVTTFLGTEINEPAEGQLFNVILTFSGYQYDQKAMTYIANGRTDHGNYNIQYKEAANQNLAQAFTFTKVEGSKYKMSQIDADGNVRYISTGVPYSGNTSQIRTTTDADKALLVEVIPTNTEGVWNLKNTEANQFIGSQDVGVFTVNSHIDFNIVETTKPSIAINTTAAGYGTTMLPFAVASLPEGVKAYTCAEVSGNTLTLDEVTALEANKPYIIEGAWEANLTGDAQGTALTYTDGLLTGVYAQTDAPVGSYVLQNLNDVVGFYKVAEGEGKQPKVGANHAYLTVPSEARALYFNNATAIRAIEALTSGEAEIYNAAGARQNSLQKGVNIIKQGGKTVKVMVK